MKRSALVRAFGFVSLLVGTTRCSETTAPRSHPLDNSIGVIVSGLLLPHSATASTPSSPIVTTRLVYVSLPPGSVAGGEAAAIRNRTTGVGIMTAVVDGGFDPVSIGASLGDTLAIDIAKTSTDSVHAYLVVAARRSPRVVRTSPPPGGRDVPLNAAVVVVFSEPLDPGTVDTAAVQLWRDTMRVQGTVQVTGGSQLIAAFQPSSLLAPQTAYRLTVSSQILGVSGMAVTPPAPVGFTTGGTVAPPGATKLAFTVQPGTVTAGALFSGVVVAIQDSLGNTVTSANDVVTIHSSCVPASNCDSTFTTWSLSGGVSVQAVKGVATFSGLQLAIAASGYTLVASSGILTPATSAPFDVLPAPASSLLFVGLYRNATVGVPFTGDVAIVDFSSNTVPSATNSVTLSLAAGPSGATLSGTLTASAVAGVAHFSDLRVNQPGTYALAATASGLAGTTGPFVAYSSGVLVSVQTGENHSCGLTAGGVAFCWGLNDHGQLGDSTTINRTSPVPVTGGLTFQDLVTGGNHTCGLSAGTWYCWGANGGGQLGDGTTSDRSSPVAIAGGLALQGLAAGGSHTCGAVARPDQDVLYYCWGLNDRGQLGDGTTTSKTSPTLVYGIGPSFGPLAAGANHTCAQNYDTGDTFCWGANDRGQLDDSTTIDRATPHAFWGVPCGLGPPGFVPPGDCPAGGITPFNMGITAGGAHTCAGAGGFYAMSYAWYCWGANGSGQLGDGTTTDRASPALVGGGRQLALVRAGGAHTCGIGGVPLPVTNGQILSASVYCWGSNSNGQLGDGTTTQRTNPVLVGGGLSFQSVSTGGNHTCGVTTAGVYCWGSNASGQLGIGNTTDSSVPVKVSGQQ